MAELTKSSSQNPSSSPTRPTHRITRSITEVSPPTIKTGHRLYTSSHHHHYHHSSRRARSSEKEASTTCEPQSAHPNLQGADPRWREGVKSEFGTPAESRRASGAALDADVWNAMSSGNTGGYMVERRTIKEGEVKEEIERGVLRKAELRTSLENLNTLSNDQTSRLDVTYYSVLEKLAYLQSSIASLQEISFNTKDITAEFANASEDLVEEITEQMEAFDNFSSQERRIKELAARVQTGREKIKLLTDRVEVISYKVEGYERKEGEWQDKTRRRLRVMWILMSALSVVLVGLVVFRYTPAKTFGPGVVHGLGKEGLKVGEGVRGEGNETWNLKREVGVGREGVLERLKRTQEERDGEDEVLKVFDEL